MSQPSITRVVKLQDSETVKFLDLYGRERLLYDPNCKKYKDRDLRSAAARRISQAMGIPGFGPKEVISKFKNLRSSYCQELKKIAVSERSGTAEIYVPKVFWFQNMNSFIRPFVQQRPINSNLEIPTNPSSPVSIEEVSQQETAFDDFSQTVPSPLQTTRTAGILKTARNPQTADTPRRTLKRKTTTEPSSSKIEKKSRDPQVGSVEKSDEISNRSAQLPKDDSYDYFGKYVSSMLRSIGPPTAMRLQEKITSLITQAMCPPYLKSAAK